jgi:type IV pilus assembly protein PilC
LLIFYMITFLIPQFADLYVSFGVDLPGIMKFMLSLAGWMKSPFTWIIVIGALIGGLLLFSRAVATPGGALAFDRFRLAIPILGDLQEKVTVSRLCRTLSMLFEAGKTPLRALEICIPVTESPYYAKAMTDARDLFRKGAVSNLGEAFIRTGAFEPLLTGFLLVGVKAGNVGEMLAKIAGYYEDDIVSLTAMIPNVTQTVVTIVLGGVVGVIVYCVYVPMSQLVAGIH